MQIPYSKKKEEKNRFELKKNRNYNFVAKFKRETNRFGHFLTFPQLIFQLCPWSSLHMNVVGTEGRENKNYS